MDAKAEIASIKRELSSIISEMDDIASGLRSDFTGIGTDICAGALEKVADKYRGASRKLDAIDTSNVKEG